MAEKEKTISEITHEVIDEMCEHYCKYADTWNDDWLCKAMQEGKDCPLDRLY